MEELEILEHAAIRREARDVDVEAGRRYLPSHDRPSLGPEQPDGFPLDLLPADAGDPLDCGGRPGGETIGVASPRRVQAVEDGLVGRRIPGLPGHHGSQGVHGDGRPGIGGCDRQDARGDRARMTAAGGAEREQREERDKGPLAHHRVAKKLPSRRFVALSTASAAPRGGSASVR